MTLYCPTCALKWGKQLWSSNCCCDGSVPISYLGPSPLVPRQTKLEPVVQEEVKDKVKKIGKKELQRLEKALGS